jgi:hypothetical protein
MATQQMFVYVRYGETFIRLHATGLLCDRPTASPFTLNTMQAADCIAACAFMIFRRGRLRLTTLLLSTCTLATVLHQRVR